MRLLPFFLIFTGIFLLGFLSCQKPPGEDMPLGESKNFALSEDGCPIHFKAYGQGDISLVFVHDWCMDQSYWERQIPSFKVYYEVVTLDLSGHGLSGKNCKNLTIGAFGRDVKAVVEKLDLDNVILIGHGMGGPVVLEAAKAMPGRVVGLVGVETFSDSYMERLSQEQIDTFISSFKPDFFEGARQYALQNFFRSKTDEKLKRKVVMDMANIIPDVGLTTLEELLKYDGTAGLPGLKIPIRSINADMPIVTFKAIRSNAANFSLRFMANSGHFLMMENPDGFNRLLADFLGEIMLESYQQR